MREETSTTLSIFTVTLVTLSRSHQKNTEPRHTKRSHTPRIPSASASRGAARYFPLILTASVNWRIFAMYNQTLYNYGNFQQQLHLG